METLDITKPLWTALDDEDQGRVESLLAIMQPDVGVEYLIVNLQIYCIHRQGTGVLTERAADIVLDVLEPLWEKQRTLEDANYVAPNLSPEVAELLLLISGELVPETLASGSPNWYMVPSGAWRKFVEVAKAAHDRHAEDESPI